LNINWKSIALVFAGGTLGTLVRLAFSVELDSLTTLAAVNTLGSGFIGWLNSDPRFASLGKRSFWGVGFAGGFTTMSGVALMTASAIAETAFYSAGVDVVLWGIILGIFALSLLAYWGAHALTSRLTGNNAVLTHEDEEASE
jgi:fluoride ion exporter CrcB/FEX